VRCGSCRFRFRLPKRIAVTDDAIADWLGEGRKGEPPHAPEKPPSREEQTAASQSTAVLPAVSDPIRMVKSDASGALFEFPSNRLLDPQFRCSLPRRCLRCGTAAHLSAHVVIYATHLVDGLDQEGKRLAGSLVLRGEDVRSLSNEELCKRLPRVPEAPPPADLPMPYWLCDMCTERDLISGQIRLDSNTGVGLCRLWIGNLHVAEAFLVATGGKGSASHVELQQRIAATTENPWGFLSPAVQNRLQQWFKPQGGEHFLAYVPDRDLTRAEDGMAGIVVSNKRLLCHNAMRHREAAVVESLEIEDTTVEDRHHLRIKSPAWEIRKVTVDREGLVVLKAALTKGMFRVTWHG
jgi:hypothetical protein